MKILRSNLDFVVLITLLVLMVLFSPHQKLDCTHYHDHTFYGVTVNCNDGGVK